MSERVPKNRGLALWIQTVIGRAYPRVIGSAREKSWIFFEILLPLLTVLAYVGVYRALHAPEAWTGFVLLGGAMTAFWANILWAMSSQLYWEKEQGNLALYIMSPTSLMALLMGMAIGGLIATTFRAAAILVVGITIFHVGFDLARLPMVVAVFLVTMTALYGMGMMLASLFLLLNREAYHLAHLGQEPIYLFTGFFFPVSAFPARVVAVSSLVPLTLGMDAMRQLLFAPGTVRGFLPAATELAIVAALAVVYLFGAAKLLDFMERLAVREGRLTESRS